MKTVSRMLVAFSLTVAPAAAQWSGELVNLSARLRLPAGPAPAIAGAVLAGDGARPLLVRAVGPGLAAFGVTGVLADPRLTVFDAAGRAIASNDNWESEAGGAAVREAAAASAAFALAPGSRDAAVVLPAGAGALSIHVAGADTAGGVVLIEVFALGATGPRLVNLSVLATAGTGSDTLTAGFVVRGGVLPLLVRGVGPTLATFGVTGAVADPRLAVVDAAGATVADNDDWDAASTTSLVQRITADSGAFALPLRGKDAAALVSLGSGAYTAQVGGGTSAALVEIYATPAETAEINGALRGEPGNIQDNVFQSLAIDPRGPATVYLGTETNGIFKTADGGATWTRLRRGFCLDPNRLGYPQIYEIAIDPERPGTLYAATIAAPGPATGSGPEVLRSGNGGIYKSTDGGLSWQQRIDGFGSTYSAHVLLHPRPRRVRRTPSRAAPR
jgi:hypothetical protein